MVMMMIALSQGGAAQCRARPPFLQMPPRAFLHFGLAPPTGARARCAGEDRATRSSTAHHYP
eukprot:8300697-Pyramimonas_sp.AAC.1